MADQALNILDAIDTRLTTYTASGQTLEDIRSYLIRYDKNDIPSSFGSKPPILLVEGLEGDSESVSIPAIMTRKTFPVRFQIFVEQANYPDSHMAATLLNLLEDVFHLQQLGISNLLVSPCKKTYSIPVREEFADLMEGGAEMTITYKYTDTRAVP